MVDADAFLVCPHEDHHPIADVMVFCRSCRRLVIVRTDVSEHNARTVQILVLTIATLGAAVLFRLTNQVWPAYLYLSLGLTFLYAIVLSRGRGTITAASIVLGLVTTAWSGWWLVGPHIHLTRVAAALLHALPAMVWILSLIAVLLMRRWALPITKEPGTYLLAVATFALGFWGVWATLLQGGLVTPSVYQIAVYLGFAAPLAFIPLIRKWPPYRNSNGSLIIWITIVAAYLVIADLVIQGLGYMMGQLFPHILGLAPLTPMDSQIGYPVFRAAMTVAAFGIMLLVGLVDSVVTVAQSFRRPDLPVNADVPPVIRVTTTRAEGLGVFVVEVTKEFINKFRGFARLINLVVPVVVFTGLSVLLILMLDGLHEYNMYGAFVEPTAIWGMAILTMTLALVGYGVAVFFAPWPEQLSSTEAANTPVDSGGGAAETAGLDRRTPRSRNWLSIVKASGVLLSGSYVFVSVASSVLLAVWLTLPGSGQSHVAFAPGPVYLINLVFAFLVVGALLVVGVAVDWARQRLAMPAPHGDRAASAARSAMAMALVLLGITAMVVGVRPMIQVFSFVFRSRDAVADVQLRAVVPAAFAGSCTPDHLVLANSRADLACTVGNHDLVSYHLFPNTTEMNKVYVSILNGRGLDPSKETCPSTDKYAYGQVSCYVYAGTAWTVWTDDRSGVLSLAARANGNLTDLYGYWLTGVMGPAEPNQP